MKTAEAILKEHYVEYFKPLFPYTKDIEAKVDLLLGVKEETEIIYKAMEAYANQPRWISIDVLQTLRDAIEYAAKEENANYVITTQDIELIDSVLNTLPDKPTEPRQEEKG